MPVSVDVIFDAALVTPLERLAFEFFIGLADTNPRRVKRIVSVYCLISQTAKSLPIHDGSSRTINSQPDWQMFTFKLIKWVCLCECYPYRMSFLIHSILDYEQKAIMNHIASTCHHQVDPDLHYRDFAGEDIEELKDDMPISKAFFTLVERYLFALPSASKLIHLDGDPELFAILISVPVPDADALKHMNSSKTVELGYLKDHSAEVTISDVIGRKLKTHNRKSLRLIGIKERQTRTSLMYFSYNLNPALRVQISNEMSAMGESKLTVGSWDQRGEYAKEQQMQCDALQGQANSLRRLLDSMSSNDASRSEFEDQYVEILKRIVAMKAVPMRKREIHSKSEEESGETQIEDLDDIATERNGTQDGSSTMVETAAAASALNSEERFHVLRKALERAKRLLDDGLITQDDYEKRKTDVLSAL